MQHGKEEETNPGPSQFGTDTNAYKVRDILFAARTLLTNRSNNFPRSDKVNKFLIPVLLATTVLSANAFADHGRYNEERYERHHRHHHSERAFIRQEPQMVYQAPPAMYREPNVYRERPVAYYYQPEPRHYAPQPVYSRYNDNRAVGNVVGAVAGGVVGSQFGQGNGRIAATAVGAVIGSLIGRQLADPY